MTTTKTIRLPDATHEMILHLRMRQIPHKRETISQFLSRLVREEVARANRNRDKTKKAKK